MASRNTASPTRPRPSGLAGAASASTSSAPAPPTPASPSNPAQQPAAPVSNIRKRRNHRGGKKKRRKSFAVVGPSHGMGMTMGGDDDAINEDVETDPLKDAAQTAASSRDMDFYNLRSSHNHAHGHTHGHGHGRSISSSSAESEGLLHDHRDRRDQQPFLRARRPSIVTSQSQAARIRPPNVGNDDDDDDEGAPLLSRSAGAGGAGSDLLSATSARSSAFASYGTNITNTNNNKNNANGNDGSNDIPPLRHNGSSHSSLRRKFLNPFSSSVGEPLLTPATAAGKSAGTTSRYSINYPPSVPGSPPLRPTDRLLDHNNLSFGDQMLRDELRSPSSPQLRRSDTSSSKTNLNKSSDALLGGERDQRGREGSVGGDSKHSAAHTEGSVLGIGVSGVGEGEDDVCFPQERLSEIAEDEDDGSREHDNGGPWRSRPNRRRRGKWPDLPILDEWSRFEKEGRREGRRAKKIKEPQLINGRLRPVHKGWHRAEEDAPYRFTYFNEEFQSTIHSQTISELVQPGGSFRELFIPDPPILSDSEEEDEIEAAGDAAAGYEDAEIDGERTMAGMHGDSFSPLNPVQVLDIGLSRDPLYVAEALSNTGDNFRLGTHSGGSVSPEKSGTGSGSGTGSATPLARARQPQSTSAMLERSLSQQMGAAAGTAAGTAEARSPDLYPTRTLSPSPMIPIALTPSRQAELRQIERENLANATPIAGETAGAKLPKQPRYGERPVWWLDVLSPTEAEMKILSKAFGIHPLTAEDIIMQEAREKVELFHHYYFVSYRSFDQDPSSETFLDPVNVYVVVFREGVLSFHFSMTPHPANVRRRIRQLSDYMILSSDWISYAIIDDITDVFVPLIQKIEEEVDDIDDAILQMHSMAADPLSAMGREKKQQQQQLMEEKERENSGGNSAAATAESDTNMLLRVGDCRKRVMSLYRLLGNKADVIKGFAKRCNEHWEVAPRSEIGLYLGDIQDHIVTMTSNLSHYEKILSRAHGNYLAQINIRMNERQEQTADVLGKLTVLGTIVLPMNIITGLWGMNVWVPGQGIDNDLRWFLVITAGLFAFGMACYMIAKRVYKIV